MYKEIKIRSVIKTITWRFLATLTTFSLVFIFTGKFELALTVGAIEAFIKMLIYFLHERGWDRIHWGRHELKPFVLWITGLSGSGKTEIAKKVIERLQSRGLKTEHLDGETIRDLFTETGFSKEEVNLHIRRVGHLASRLEKSGVFVVASFISPYRNSRQFIRNLCDHFIEVHVDTPLEECEKRDYRRLYSRARNGKIHNLPGVDVVYEKPENPDLRIDISDGKLDDSVEEIMVFLKDYI